MSITVAAVSANFTRDLEQNYALIEQLLGEARAQGAQLVVFPEASIGGYLSSLGNHGDTVRTTARSLPPAISLDGPEIRRVQALAGQTVVCIGFCELDADGETRYNAAVCLDGERVYGSYRKVHQPLGENMSYAAGDTYRAFDTPVGPHRAADLLRQGLPGGRPGTGSGRRGDRGQPFGVARGPHRHRRGPAAGPVDVPVQPLRRRPRARQPGVLDRVQPSGTFGSLRYVGNAKVVDPGGNVLATTLLGAGLAVAEVDVEGTFRAMRGGMFHLRDRRPDLYGAITATDAPEATRWTEAAHA